MNEDTMLGLNLRMHGGRFVGFDSGYDATTKDTIEAWLKIDLKLEDSTEPPSLIDGTTEDTRHDRGFEGTPVARKLRRRLQSFD